jgi:hypothetical protein
VRPTMVRLLVVAVLACVASVGVLSSAAAGSGGGCHAPLLEGLTFKLARAIAGHAGCKIRIKGNPLAMARIQTVARQSPAAGGVAPAVTVWLNRVCRKGGDQGPEIHEPKITVGPTRLLSGFYIVGGPAPHYFSAPKCPRHPEPPPCAGTVEVINASGVVVSTQTSVARQFVEIPLPAGSYTIRGTFANATVNGVHPTVSQSVVVPAGHTVRQDFFFSAH